MNCQIIQVDQTNTINQTKCLLLRVGGVDSGEIQLVSPISHWCLEDWSLLVYLLELPHTTLEFRLGRLNEYFIYFFFWEYKSRKSKNEIKTEFSLEGSGSY